MWDWNDFGARLSNDGSVRDAMAGPATVRGARTGAHHAAHWDNYILFLLDLYETHGEFAVNVQPDRHWAGDLPLYARNWFWGWGCVCDGRRSRGE